MFLLDGRNLGPPEPTYIVAELGVNHNGDPVLARELLYRAKDAGADAAKLQLFVPEELATDHAVLCEYQRPTGAQSQLAMLRSLTVPGESLQGLREEARQLGIALWASVFDPPSLRQAAALGFPVIKIGSGELTCLPLHEEVSRCGKPVMLSCGMAVLDEIRPIVDLYHRSGVPLLLLHCVSAYPAPEQELNLRSISFLNKEFDLPVGFSDHTAGFTAACLAVAAGAVLIERHLTLSRELPGPDHRASLEPEQFAEFVQRIRDTESILGEEGAFVAACEHEVRGKVRKSIVLRRPILPGHLLAREDLAFRRPGTGISPMEVTRVVGRSVTRDFPSGHLLRWEDLTP